MTATRSGAARRRAYMALCVVASVAFFVTGVTFGRHGWILAIGLLALINSPVAQYFISKYEGTDPRLVFSRSSSWTFLYGDSVCLPLLFMGDAGAWREPTLASWHDSVWLVIGSATIGIVAALAYELLLDRPGSRQASEEGRLTSRTRLWHIIVTYPSLVGMAVYLTVPIFISGIWLHSVYFWVAAVGMLGWLVLGDVDSVRFNPHYDGTWPLKYYNLYPEMNENWEIISPVGQPSAKSRYW